MNEISLRLVNVQNYYRNTVFMWISLKTKAESPFTEVHLTNPMSVMYH